MRNIDELTIGVKNASTVDWKLTLFAIILSLGVLVRDLGLLSVSPAFFISVVTIACFVLPYSSLCPFAFFLLPFWSAFHGMAALPLLIALIIKSKKHNGAQFLFSVLIMLLELIHFVSYSFEVEINKYIVFCIMIGMFFYILFDETKNRHILLENIKWFVAGTSIVISIIIIHYILLFGFSEMLMGGMRIGGDDDVFRTGQSYVTRYAAMNANTLAYYAVVAFSLVLVVNDLFKLRASKWFYMGLLLLAGLLTTSRTWLLILPVLLILYFLFSKTKGKLQFAVSIGLLLIIAIQFSNVSDVFTMRFEDRLSSQNVESAGLRGELFKEYNAFLFNNTDYLIYGTGAVYYKNVCNIWNSVHNGTQQIIVCYGILGIIIFIGCGIFFFQKYCKRKKIRALYFIPFLICFLFDQSLQFLNPVQLMFPFLASLLPLKFLSENK